MQHPFGGTSVKSYLTYAIFAGVCSAAASTFGQDFSYTLSPPAWSSVINNTGLYRLQLDRLTQDRRPEAPSRKAAVAPSTPTTPARNAAVYSPPQRASAIMDLAAAYPEAARAQAEAVFRDLLRQYGNLEQRFGIPPRDLGGAIAALLAGSYMAYRGVDFPDEHFKPLVAQMQTMVASNPEFDSVSEADRQYTYDQLAALGMFMATTQMALQQRPNEALSAKMRSAAKGYLEQLLKADAQRVQITATGLSLK